MVSIEDFAPGIEEALEHGGGTHSLADVIEAVKTGKAQLWLEEDALLVTEVLQHPNKLVLYFWLATGEMEAVIALSRRVIEWGKKQGCTAAGMMGRKGWTRALREEGWAPTMVQYTKEI